MGKEPIQAIERCAWCLGDPLYVAYHDREWGQPVHDDRVFFEFLLLEGAQAGLSWLTILRKRENYRKAFARFNPQKVARFDAEYTETLLQNPGIVRNRLKVNAAITNAQRFLEIQERHGTFDAYIWQFVDGKPVHNNWQRLEEVPATSKESDAMSRELKRQGFKFVGSTIMYAFMQATGLVNDHLVGCFRHSANLSKSD